MRGSILISTSTRVLVFILYMTSIKACAIHGMWPCILILLWQLILLLDDCIICYYDYNAWVLLLFLSVEYKSEILQYTWIFTIITINIPWPYWGLVMMIYPSWTTISFQLEKAVSNNAVDIICETMQATKIKC